MTTKIFASQLSPFSARLRLAVALKKLDIAFEVPPGGSGSAELKQITPFGKVPALVDGDQVLVESLALLEYLEDAYPGTRSLRPSDPIAAARVRMIALLFDTTVFKALGGVFAQLAAPAPDVNAAKAAFDDVETEIRKLVYFFDASGLAVGGRFSIADCAMVPFAFLMDALAAGFGAAPPTQRVPRFAAWWEDARQVPEVAAVIEHMQQALAAMMAARKAAAAKQS